MTLSCIGAISKRGAATDKCIRFNQIISLVNSEATIHQPQLRDRCRRAGVRAFLVEICSENGDAAAQISKQGPPEPPTYRGRPLPPSGQPISHPEGSLLSSSPLPKRKQVLPPTAPEQESVVNNSQKWNSKPPPFERRKRQSSAPKDDQPDEDLIVEALSDPDTPTLAGDTRYDDFLSHCEDRNSSLSSSSKDTPELSRRLASAERTT